MAEPVMPELGDLQFEMLDHRLGTGDAGFSLLACRAFGRQLALQRLDLVRVRHSYNRIRSASIRAIRNTTPSHSVAASIRRATVARSASGCANRSLPACTRAARLRSR